MTQNFDLTGNTIIADGFTVSTSPLSVAGVGVYVGAGVPSLSATKGSIYLNTSGSSTSTRLYVNNGTTNWVAITTAS